MQITEQLQKRLNKRLENNSLRKLSVSERLVDFYSNDYLGLAQNQELFSNISQMHSKFHVNGATGSRLLSGNSKFYEELEQKLAIYFTSESTLIFNSGYTANLAVLSSIPQKGDTIIYDELSHACIKDGARLSLAKRYSFKHNDLNDLKHKLNQANGQIFIVVESIYSMDGDECPLVELIKTARPFNANIILDEAHATGIYGPKGSGLSGHLEVQHDIFARIYTFGKAMGVHGAAVAGSSTLINFLINFARPFIYTTALPPHSLIAINAAFRYLAEHMSLQHLMEKKVTLFKKQFNLKIGSQLQKIESNHAIQSIIIPENDRVKEAYEYLKDKGFDVRPILSPTVKKGTERLRVCLHTFNSDDDISQLIDTLANIK